MRQLIIVSLMLCFVGCASIDKVMTGQNAMPDVEKRQELVQKFPTLTAGQKQKFLSGSAWIGMTQEQLEALWGGEPVRRQKKLTSTGNEEIQIYAVRVGNWKTGTETKYFKVKILEDKLTEMQELDSIVGSLDRL